MCDCIDGKRPEQANPQRQEVGSWLPGTGGGKWMSTWMDEWMDGCMAGWVDGWMSGWMGGWWIDG